MPKPINILAQPQSTLTIAEERPIPGGLAKGDWNFLPAIPWVRWGMALIKKTPAKKPRNNSMSMIFVPCRN